MNQIAALGAAQGEQIEIKASGPQAIQAVKALKNLVENKFKEKYQGEFQIKNRQQYSTGFTRPGKCQRGQYQGYLRLPALPLALWCIIAPGCLKFNADRSRTPGRNLKS